jgi:hypothetical protein
MLPPRPDSGVLVGCEFSAFDTTPRIVLSVEGHSLFVIINPEGLTLIYLCQVPDSADSMGPGERQQITAAITVARR